LIVNITQCSKNREVIWLNKTGLGETWIPPSDNDHEMLCGKYYPPSPSKSWHVCTGNNQVRIPNARDTRLPRFCSTLHSRGGSGHRPSVQFPVVNPPWYMYAHAWMDGRPFGSLPLPSQPVVTAAEKLQRRYSLDRAVGTGTYLGMYIVKHMYVLPTYLHTYMHTYMHTNMNTRYM
jgi:hypothetical protein